MPEAEYVTLDDTATDQLMAVYASGMNPEELVPIVKRLGKLQGCQAQIILMLLDGQDDTPAVLMKLDSSLPEQLPAAAALFRRLTSPKLPCTLIKGDFTLVICRCGVVSLSRELNFLIGFGPDPTAEPPRLQDVVTTELIERYAITKDPSPITDELWRILTSHGIHVKELSLDHRLESTCSHDLPKL